MYLLYITIIQYNFTYKYFIIYIQLQLQVASTSKAIVNQLNVHILLSYDRAHK